MQPPMPTALVRKCEAVTALHGRTLLGIKTFVDDDSAGVEPDCSEDVGVEPEPEPAARYIEQPVQVVELNAKLEVLFDDVLDRDRRLHLDAPGMGVLRAQGLGIAFDGVVGHERDSKGHPRFILICIVGRRLQPRLFFLRLLGLPRQAGHVLCRQPFRRSQEVGHFPWALADDVGQL
jgi:hypothetical protein